MKIMTVLLVALTMLISSCATSVDNSKKISSASLSYAFGVLVGNSLSETQVEINSDEFIQAVREVLNKEETLISTEQAQEMVQAGIDCAKSVLASKNAEEERMFLEENGKKTGIIKTESGLQYQVLELGNGTRPNTGDTVTIHYVGKLIDGTVFDSSIERETPASFPLDGVIEGLAEGIALMQIEGKSVFYVPSKLAYGDQAPGGKIGPNQLLIFEVELLSSEATPAVEEEASSEPDFN